jgi:predicted regulator of Ras-like GTPase activity (Roadblock/LC7/MglB family)
MRRPPGHWSLSPADVERLDETLAGLVDDSGARCAVLIHRAGQQLAAAGDRHHLDEAAFATLAAADFAASDQLALLLGEDHFSTLYHQGERASLFVLGLDSNTLLAVLFDDRTTLGLVRLRGRAVVPQLKGLVAAIAGDDRRSARLGRDWVDAAGSELDRLLTG